MPSPLPATSRLRRRVRAAILVAAAASPAGLAGACAKPFNAAKFTDVQALYRSSEDRFRRRKWDDALAGFDRLATQLPARDTLLPRVFHYQGRAHARKGEHLLAAQAYARIGDAFPDDSLADDALYEQAHEYQLLWRKPSLDAQYGQTALATYRQLVQLYPESPLAPRAERQAAVLTEQFARKDLETAEHYLRRKAYDPALIYLKDIVRLYPGTPAARSAHLRMVDAYRAIKYQEEIVEACADLRRTYPGDAAVDRACGSAPVTAGSAAPPAPAPAPTPPA